MRQTERPRTLVKNSGSAAETQAIGQLVGSALQMGNLVALIGPLGAGKTAMVKGIALGAGLSDPRRVTSPTFVIVNEYFGRLRLFHIDAYRLGGLREFDALGVDEFLEEGAVLVEWADRVEAALPVDRLVVTIEPTGDQTRLVRLSALGGQSVAILNALTRLPDA